MNAIKRILLSNHLIPAFVLVLLAQLACGCTESAPHARTVASQAMPSTEAHALRPMVDTLMKDKHMATKVVGMVMKDSMASVKLMSLVKQKSSPMMSNTQIQSMHNVVHQAMKDSVVMQHVVKMIPRDSVMKMGNQSSGVH